MHLAALNRGILMTPFHNMALIAPQTTAADVDRHTELFREAASDRSSIDGRRHGHRSPQRCVTDTSGGIDMSAPDSRPKVVAVIGSPRRRGNTATLVDAALEELERGGCD